LSLNTKTVNSKSTKKRAVLLILRVIETDNKINKDTHLVSDFLIAPNLNGLSD